MGWIDLHKGELYCHIRYRSGRLERQGDQIVATHDVEVEVPFVQSIYSAWQQKTPLRVKTELGDELKVESVGLFRRGRNQWLKMGCERS